MNNEYILKLNIPDVSGVYFFKKGKNILYIGKATSLKDRVRSYFQKDMSVVRSPLIAKMVEESDSIDWQETPSALEALILEANLIKKYQPVYNSKEKDNKSFNHVLITKEEFPRVLLVRGHDLLNDKVSLSGISIAHDFGPFPHGKSLKEALKILRKIFPFRDGKSHKSSNSNFYTQIGLLPDTSLKNASGLYKKNIKNLVLFFQGKNKKLIRSLEKDMFLSAKREEFEDAQRIKKQIFALQHIKDVSLVDDSFVYHDKKDDKYRIEAYDVAHTQGRSVVGVMAVVQNGLPLPHEYRKFIIKDSPGINDTKALREIVERRLTHPEWKYPRLIVADGGKAQKNAIERVLRESGVEIPVVAVTKDAKHRAKMILGVTVKEKEVLLANIEAHRFAINFHRKKRSTAMFEKKGVKKVDK